MKSKRFEPLRDLAMDAATEARRSLLEAERRVAELERQMAQLRAYRDEYVGKAAQPGGAMDVVSLRNHRQFLDRLSEALRTHAQNLGVARADCEARRTQWTAKRVEAESLNRAVERYRHEERLIADRIEQRDGDETALRVALSRLER
jgi:flagellar FliJ protein